MKKLLLPILLIGGVLGATRYAQTQTTSDGVLALTSYRVALDRIAAGKPNVARLLLESDQQNGPLGPESAALLAYLQEKAGDDQEAVKTLQKVSNPTAFTGNYLKRLGGTPAAPTEAAIQALSPLPDMVSNLAPNPARLEPTDARITKLEKQLWQMINEDRRHKGLDTLDWNDDIASVARAHSAEMRDKRYFAHESPTAALRMPLDRYQAGIRQLPRTVAENVYHDPNHDSLNENGVREAHITLMNSPGHRANILLDGITKMGVGIASDANGSLWVTEMFAQDMNPIAGEPKF